MPLSSVQGFSCKGNERGGLANGSSGGSCGISAHAPNLFASARRRRLNRAIAKTRVAAIGSFGVCVCPCVLAQFDDVAFGRFMFAWQSPTGTVQEMLQTPHPLLRWTDGGVARTRGTTASGDGGEGEADSAHRGAGQRPRLSARRRAEKDANKQRTEARTKKERPVFSSTCGWFYSLPEEKNTMYPQLVNIQHSRPLRPLYLRCIAGQNA